MKKEMTPFIRLEGFARTAPHKKNSRERKSSVAGIFGEMLRQKGFCPHIPETDVKDPKIVFGDPEAVLQEILGQAGAAVDKRGRKLKSTSLVMCAGVVSYPIPQRFVEADAEERARHARWWAMTRLWLANYFGERLRLIVVHEDEEHPHAHFVVVPVLGPDRQIRIGDVHPGERAQRAAKEESRSPKQQQEAFERAMTEFIDAYYDDVLLELGFARFGPELLRLDRPGWKLLKKQLMMVAEKSRQIEATVAKAAAEAEARADARVAAIRAAAAEQVMQVRRQAALALQSMKQENEQLRAKVTGQEAHIAEVSRCVAELEDEVSEYRIAYRRAG